MNKKRTVAWLLVIMLLCSMGVQAFAQDSAISYSDIDGHWAQKMIEEFTERGYLKGYIDGTFRPDYPVTRAEAGAFVSRLGFPETHPLIDYSDLIEGAWYYDGVRTATRTGFVHGYPDGTYRPDAFILRQEATKLASHFWGEVDMEGFRMRFTDTDRIADWAFPHMSKLVKMGLLDGYPDNTVRPENNLTRAEFVKLFYMILIEPTYANVTVRAVDADNLSNDIIEPKIVSREIGSTVEFDAPEVPSRWNLVGDATQTHVIGQGLEVVFKYRYTQPSGGGGGGGSTPVTNYTLSLAIEPGQGGTVSGGGSYPAGTAVTVSAAVYSGYEFVGWYEGVNLVSSNSQFTYTMPAQNTTLVASFVPEGTQLYTLTLTANLVGGGTVTGGGSYAAGTAVAVSAEVNTNFVFEGWFDEEGTELISEDAQFSYTMPAEDITLLAWFTYTGGGEVAAVPELDDHDNYNVDEILTITYDEDDNEFAPWRASVYEIEIWAYEAVEPDVISLPHPGVDISTPGELTLDPEQIPVLQTAGQYQIVAVSSGGGRASVEQVVYAGAVASLDYLPYRSGPIIDFNGQIYPGALATYNETPFETNLIEVYLYDQYGNECRSGPSQYETVYAEAAWDDVGAVSWTLKSNDPNNSAMPENQAVSGILGYAQFNQLYRTGQNLNYCYIIFKVYKPGQPHDVTGDNVTKNTALFVLPPVN